MRTFDLAPAWLYLDATGARVIAHIESLVGSSDGLPEEAGEYRLVPACEVLCTLVEIGATPPLPGDVEGWRDWYLLEFERWTGRTPPRRQVVRATFAKLLGLAESHVEPPRTPHNLGWRRARKVGVRVVDRAMAELQHRLDVNDRGIDALLALLVDLMVSYEIRGPLPETVERWRLAANRSARVRKGTAERFAALAAASRRAWNQEEVEMGTWGPGNFQNDGALDWLAEVVDELEETVLSRIDTPAADIDEEGESHLMPAVELLATLADRHGAIPPHPDVVSAWAANYLQRYDGRIDALAPSADYKKERRDVIEATFDRLLRAAKTFHRED
jgi:hypothetical protein